MSNPAAPEIPDRPATAGGAAIPDEPNPFGPDAPNVREDDPPIGQAPAEASPPSPPEIPLDESQFAPDEP